MKSISQSVAKGSHFRAEERLILQYSLLGSGKFEKESNTAELARRLGKTRRTIQREIKRGEVRHIKSDLTERIEYNAEYAQRDADYAKSAKGPPLKLQRDPKFIQEVSYWIGEKKYSPYAVIQKFKNEGWPTDLRICEKTLYNYIYEGLIEGLSQESLLYKGRRKSPSKGPRRHSRAANAAKSISNRPKEAQERSEAGHWEMDTVVGPQGGKKECLLVLTERCGRKQIIRKIPDRSCSSVVHAVDILERRMGSKSFRSEFKSITCDNGSEFSDYEQIERSAMSSKSRLMLYYAHPYSSFERGSNENANGIIRRFFPKGTSFDQITKKQVKEVEDWMNNYPRKILGGLTAAAVWGKAFPHTALSGV